MDHCDFFEASAFNWTDSKNVEPIVTDYHIEQLENVFVRCELLTKI